MLGSMSAPVLQCSDCAVVGGGPGGLAAAIYLARFNRQVLVYDAGKPRARWSPRNRNYPGFPEGLTGPEILERFAEQARRFHVSPTPAKVEGIDRTEAGFRIRAGSETAEVRKIILATGITDLWPQVPGAEELLGNRIRVCPICDAYETNGRSVGILGSGNKVAREALYLTGFTCRVTLFTHGLERQAPIDPALARRLEDKGVATVHRSVERMVARQEDGVTLFLEGDQSEEVDLLFSALGVRPNSELAASLGAQLDEQGYVVTDRWQQTSVPGLFAVGDVTFEINQVTVAVGQAAVAATAVHNSLLDF